MVGLCYHFADDVSIANIVRDDATLRNMCPKLKELFV